MRPPLRWLHANALLVGEAAVLIRGPSGAGKSRLTLALIEAGPRRGLFTCLIGDDRVAVAAQAGRLVVSAHPAIAGQIEDRGTGIVHRPHEAGGVVKLLVDLEPPGGSDILPRLPAPEDEVAELEGIPVRRLVRPGGAGFSAAESVHSIFSALERE
jgi:serine kinase of HPr protein (carbohydrate metabolism regulator)